MNIFNSTKLHQHRQRAAKNFQNHDFIHLHALKKVESCLADIKKPLTSIAITGDHFNVSKNKYNHIDIKENEFIKSINNQDAIISFMTLHQLNDPVGHLIQLRKMLKPDQPFVAVFIGGNSLFELKDVFTTTEITKTGGISPRFMPMIDIRDAGSLLQRAGFTLPTADSEIITITYSTIYKLIYDIRGTGCGNILTKKPAPLTRSFFQECNKNYLKNHSNNNLLNCTLELITLIGWSPDASQPSPLKRGSATTSMKDVL